jgi:hypothetical protein
MEAICENDPRFKRTWDRERRDFQDQSASSYEMSLADAAARAGWSDQEAANLMIAWRRKHGEDVTKSLRPDYVARTLQRAKANIEPEGGKQPAPEKVSSLRSLSSQPGAAVDDGTRWPDPPSEEARRGLAGDVIRAIEPHTEADPAALLLQFLVCFGNVIGRTARFVADGATHGLNLFVVLVGVTSKARKGTSWNHIHRIYATVDSGWASDCIPSGLSSGEGLIWAVRDPITKRERVKDSYKELEVDPGVSDKRLVALEQEFASVLRVLGREGNTLSAVIRQAWDHGNLRSLTKNSPAKATGSYISVVGHITGDELQRYLDTTEAANGFGNRFLWACARRSKCLPEGGEIHKVDFGGLVRRLNEAVQHARSVGEMRRDEEARELWRTVYPELSEGLPGLLGAMISRAEAQVMRLACIYALLDRSPVIGVAHLRAALAVWKYCEESARYVFGASLGDPVMDEILSALRGRKEGLSRTEIRDLFSRHCGASQIGRALSLLLGHGLARREKETTGGKPSERWFAIVGGAT